MRGLALFAPLAALLLGAFSTQAESTAQAVISLQDQVLQKGIFVKPACAPDASDPGYDGCRCDADIRYPQIMGLSDADAQAALNARFKQVAEKAQCPGEPVKPEEKSDKSGQPKKSAASSSYHYVVTFQSGTILALKNTAWSYSGGAHGDGSVEGIIIDTETGKTLSPAIMFGRNVASVNQVIYDTLSVRPEGEVFRDQIEQRKGAFILDGQCQGCTLMLMPGGLRVVFQTYEVASFAEGNIEVPVPDNLIDYKPVAEAMAAQEEGKK